MTREGGIYFKEEKNPQYLVDKLNSVYAVMGKLQSVHAKRLSQAIYGAIDEIVLLCKKHEPAQSARATWWKRRRATFERAVKSDRTMTPVEVGK